MSATVKCVIMSVENEVIIMGKLGTHHNIF